MLGDGEAVEVAQMVWVVADREHAKFGDTLPGEVVDNPGNSAVFETKGTCVVEGTEVFIQRMLLTEVEVFNKRHTKDDQDMRLLRVHTDKVGKRRLDLENSLALMTEDKMEDFPPGAENRAVKESLTAVSDGPRTQSRYHTEWHHIANEIVSYQVKLACEEGSAIELRDKRPLRNFPLAQF